MCQSVESVLKAAHRLPPEELRQLIDHLLSGVSSELQADDQLRQEILEAEQQISREDVVPWSEVKRQHEL